jgi:hypothetical protein
LNLNGINLAQVLRDLIIPIDGGGVMFAIVHPADVGFKQAVQRRDNQPVCGMPQYGNEKDKPRSEALWQIQLLGQGFAAALSICGLRC